MMADTETHAEVFLTELSGGPLDGTHWVFNHDSDIPTADPSVAWIAQPEPRTWPLPDMILADGPGCYVKDSESQMPPQTGKRSHVVRGAFYVWRKN